MPASRASSAGPCGRVLLLVLLLLLAPTLTMGQWSPTRRPTMAPTWRPTPPPTAAPLTDRCNLTGYQQLVAANNGSESCFACRRDFECAWCIPESPAGAQPFCMDNRFTACPGRMGSYSTDICAKPLSAGTAAALFALFVLLPLLCCAGCCFMALRWRARRPAAAAVLVPAPGMGGGQPRPPTPVGVGMTQYPVAPVGSTGYSYDYQPPQGATTPYYGPAQPQAQPQQPTYYYGAQPATTTTTNYTVGAPGLGQVSYTTTAYGGGHGHGSVSPGPLPPPVAPASPPPPPSYPGAGYGYGGQPTKGAYM